jgi:hypothetical protein
VDFVENFLVDGMSVVVSLDLLTLSIMAVAKHLTQARKIVLHNLVKPMRVERVVHIGEHIADPVVPFLHRL